MVNWQSIRVLREWKGLLRGDVSVRRGPLEQIFVDHRICAESGVSDVASLPYIRSSSKHLLGLPHICFVVFNIQEAIARNWWWKSLLVQEKAGEEKWDRDIHLDEYPKINRARYDFSIPNSNSISHFHQNPSSVIKAAR